jgi:hypothetical protein
VVSERDDVRAGGEEPVGELRRDPGSVRDVLAVDDREVGAELLPQPGQPFLDGPPAGGAEDVREEEKPQLRTRADAGWISTVTWLPASFV